MWWPAASRGLRGKPRAVATLLRARRAQAPASTVEQGQPGIEPGRTLAVAAGLLGRWPSKHNGLLHKLRPIRHQRCRMNLSSHNSRYVLRPAAPARGTSALVPRPIPILVRPWQAIATGIPARRCARHGGWPRPSAIRPRGAPQRLPSPITSTNGEDHHARANHH
jgi:hypothetical protein